MNAHQTTPHPVAAGIKLQFDYCVRDIAKTFGLDENRIFQAFEEASLEDRQKLYDLYVAYLQERQNYASAQADNTVIDTADLLLKVPLAGAVMAVCLPPALPLVPAAVGAVYARKLYTHIAEQKAEKACKGSALRMIDYAEAPQAGI